MASRIHTLTTYHLSPGVAVSADDVVALHLVAGEDKGNNETIQTQSLGEDKDKDDTNEQLGLVSVRSDTSITDDANGNTSRETSHATAKASSEGRVARVRSIAVWVGSLNGGAEEHRDD